MWNSSNVSSKQWHAKFIYLILSSMVNLVLGANEVWPDGPNRPVELPTVNTFDVMCGKDHMDIQVRFTGPFNGIISSKGHINDPNCLYVPPVSGKSFYTFRVPYARCGTKPDLHGQFYENTVVIQYDKDLMEAWDEPKRLRCEWFNEYEKTASKPPMVIADLDVIQLDFRGDNVDCWMEIQSGKGPWSQPVSGIVPIGSTLTLVVAINDYRGEFDMRVKSCVASDGLDHVINLSDEFGCVLRPKMISRFVKARAPNDKATVITYAFFHAFKFPDALSVHINCKVEICRNGCMDHCQQVASNKRADIVGHKMIETNAIEQPEINRLDAARIPESNDPDNDINDDGSGGGSADEDDDSSFYEEFADAVGLKTKTSSKDIEKIVVEKQQPKSQLEQKPSLQIIHSEPDLPPIRVHLDQPPKSMYEVHEDFVDSLPPQNLPTHDMLHQAHIDANRVNIEKFPHGPRSFSIERMGLLLPPPPPPASPPRPQSKAMTRPKPRPKTNHDSRSMNIGQKIRRPPMHSGQRFVVVNRSRRHRRSITVSDGQSQSADIGVVGMFDVVSEADLAFNPSDGKPETETVLQGKITDEILYGICMPMPVFSVLFILIILTAVVLVLTVGSLYYRYQLQKEMVEKQTATNANANADANINPNSLGSWITLRLFRMNEMQPCDPITGIIPESST